MFETEAVKELRRRVQNIAQAARASQGIQSVAAASIDVNSKHIGDLCDSIIELREDISLLKTQVDETVRTKLFEYKGKIHKRINTLADDAELEGEALRLLFAEVDDHRAQLDIVNEEMLEVLDIVTNDEFDMDPVPGHRLGDYEGVEILPPRVDQLRVEIDEALAEDFKKLPLSLQKSELIAEWSKVFAGELLSTSDFTEDQMEQFIVVAGSQLVDAIDE